MPSKAIDKHNHLMFRSTCVNVDCFTVWNALRILCVFSINDVHVTVTPLRIERMPNTCAHRLVCLVKDCHTMGMKVSLPLSNGSCPACLAGFSGMSCSHGFTWCCKVYGSGTVRLILLDSRPRAATQEVALLRGTGGLCGTTVFLSCCLCPWGNVHPGEPL